MTFEASEGNIDFGIKEKEGKNIFYFGDKEYELYEFDLNDIENQKEYYKKKGMEFREEYYYNGLLRNRGNILDHYGIKDEYLQYALLNEHFCPEPLYVESGTCALSLKEELALVPKNIKEEYIKWRIEFFKGIQKMSLDGINYEKEELDQKYYIEMGLCVGYLSTVLLKYDLERKIGYITNDVKEILD